MEIGFEVLIPITFFLTIGMVLLGRGEIGRAIAHRIRGGAGAWEPEVTRLREEVEALRRELGETQERLDFTERLLAQGREPQQLPRG